MSSREEQATREGELSEAVCSLSVSVPPSTGRSFDSQEFVRSTGQRRPIGSFFVALAGLPRLRFSRSQASSNPASTGGLARRQSRSRRSSQMVSISSVSPRPLGASSARR